MFSFYQFFLQYYSDKKCERTGATMSSKQSLFQNFFLSKFDYNFLKLCPKFEFKFRQEVLSKIDCKSKYSWISEIMDKRMGWTELRKVCESRFHIDACIVCIKCVFMCRESVFLWIIISYSENTTIGFLWTVWMWISTVRKIIKNFLALKWTNEQVVRQISDQLIASCLGVVKFNQFWCFLIWKSFWFVIDPTNKLRLNKWYSRFCVLIFRCKLCIFQSGRK